MKKLFLILSLLVIALLGGLTLYVELLADRTPAFTAKLADVVPEKLEGWAVRDVPLAENEGQLEQVNRILLFDDFVQREYRIGDLSVIVYAAYWTPGKVTTADAGTHNPDSCWVNTGWTRHERKYAMDAEFGGSPILPCEFGVYSKSGSTSNVMFWHLVSGVPQRYEDQQTGWRSGLVGRIERLPLVLDDIRKYGLNQKREQLFVRISANKPYGDFKDNPDFVKLMESLRGLGIFKDSAWGAAAQLAK